MIRLLSPIATALRRLADLLFGYDFFISYAHSDGISYPHALADRLQQMGYKVFLDKHVYVAGIDLKVATRRRIRMSKKLVLVARSHALESQWVRREVETCLAAERTPIIVDVNETLADAPAELAVKKLLEDKLYIAESLADQDGEPTAHVLGELHRSFRSTRQEVVRLRLVSLAAVFMAIVAAIAVWQFLRAEQRRREAVRQRDTAFSRLVAMDADRFLDSQPDRALLLAAMVARLRPSFDSRDLLMRTIGRAPRLIRFLHGEEASWKAVALSVDGSRLLTADDGGELVVWQRSGSSLERRSLGQAPTPVSSVALSDGLAAAGTESGASYVWDLSSGSLLHELSGRRRVSALAFSADGSRLVTAAAFTDTYLWDPRTGERLARLDQHKSAPRAIAFSPDGSQLVTGAEGGRLVLWRLDEDWRDGDKSPPHEVLPQRLQGLVHTAAFSPDGGRLAAGGEDSFVAYGSLDSPRPLGGRVTGLDAPVRELRFDAESQLLAGVTESGRVLFWKRDGHKPESMVLVGVGGTGPGLAFADDGTRLISVSPPGRYALEWDLASARARGDALAGQVTGIRSMALDAQGRLLASAACAQRVPNDDQCTESEIRIWRVADRVTLGAPIVLKGKPPPALAFGAGGRTVVAVGANMAVSTWDLESRELLRATEPPAFEHSEESTCMKGRLVIDAAGFSRDGRSLAIAASEKAVWAPRHSCIYVWSESAGWETTAFADPGVMTKVVALSDDGTRLATSGVDGSFAIWDLTRREQIDRQRVGGRTEIKGLALSADGRTLALGGRDVAPAEEERFIDSGKESGFLLVWDVDGGRFETPRPPTLPVPVSTLALSQDGRTIVTGGCGGPPGLFCLQGRIDLWDAQQARRLGPPILAHPTEVIQLAISGNGQLVASAGYRASYVSTKSDGDVYIAGDDRILIHDLSAESLIRRACEVANRGLTAEESERYLVDVYGPPCAVAAPPL